MVSNFSSIGRTALLRDLFGKLYITTQVFDEIQSGLLQGYSHYQHIESILHPFSDRGWLHLTSLQTSLELQTFGELLSGLHVGEASCISIALHREWAFLSDDKAARNAAGRLGVAVSGTLGILLLLVKRHIVELDEGNLCLQKMIESGYFSPIYSLEEILRETEDPHQ